MTDDFFLDTIFGKLSVIVYVWLQGALMVYVSLNGVPDVFIDEHGFSRLFEFVMGASILYWSAVATGYHFRPGGDDDD